MSAAVIASVAVVTCSANRSTRNVEGDTVRLVEYATNSYQVDVTFDVKAHEKIDAAHFLEYLMAYKKRDGSFPAA